VELKPEFMAPAFRSSGKLEGMSSIVTGGDSGIGRAVAVLFARESADVAMAYLNEHRDAEETRR
jgi:NAD(P)-dependent dehydrogenase (short-subunit alcohol dehydrogenase family)